MFLKVKISAVVTTKPQLFGFFNDGLGTTEEQHIVVFAISGSQLPGRYYKGTPVAFAQKYGGIAGTNVNSTIFAAIHADRGGVVHEINVTILTVRDDKLGSCHAARLPDDGL